MSRAKKKMAIIHDLQGRGDALLLKRDCDLIADALELYVAVMKKKDPEKAKRLGSSIIWRALYFRNFGNIIRNPYKLLLKNQ